MTDLSTQDKERWVSGDFIAAVIDERSELESVLNELDAEGVRRQEIRVFSGETGSEELGQIGGEGLLGWIRRTVEDHAGAAKEFTDRHKEEAASGHHVVVVPLDGEEQADDVRQILAS